MKKPYINPEIEIIKYCSDDVLTVSQNGKFNFIANAKNWQEEDII